MKDTPILSIIVPVYRSETSLEPLVKAINAALTPASIRYEVVLVNDASPDACWQVISRLCEQNPQIVGINMRRNFGQDNAIMTGLRIAKGEYMAIMDDDLQHDPGDLPALLKKAQEGYDAVYAQFNTLNQAWWKRLGSRFNGKVAEWLIDKPKGLYLSPYKVLHKPIVETICLYDGPYPYVDGLLFEATCRITQIPATHHARTLGKGNYTFWRSLSVWARLASSFSVRPLRLVSLFGLLSSILGIAIAYAVVIYRLVFPEEFGANAAGWASLMVAILVIGGIQMIFLGIMGEYVGRTYLKVNRKPQSTIFEIKNRP